jgi:hypothetical protein
MSPIRFSSSSLKEGRWYEYLVRFALGGAATVLSLWSIRRGPLPGFSRHLLRQRNAGREAWRFVASERQPSTAGDAERRLPRWTPPVLRSARSACWRLRSCFR